MAGQPQPGSNPWITFDVTNLTISEPGLPPSTVIESTNPFAVNIDFEFAGMLAPWLVSLGFNVDLRVRFESLGTGPEVTSGPTPVVTAGGTLNYSGTVNVAPGTLSPGAYKVVGTAIVPGSPIAGYFEGPILQII